MKKAGLTSRTERLLGTEVIERIAKARVIIFGVGGVGSWCAEALVRSGIRHLTIVDNDVVADTNLNRQLMATIDTVGQVKVEALRNRLLSINPDAEITALRQTYSKDTQESFRLETYDFVVDAIDSLKDKTSLIMHATEIAKSIRTGKLKREGITNELIFISSMGAALRMDPTQVRVAEFWKVRNDTLARAIRRKLKHNQQTPAVKFQCVYSEELPMQNLGDDNALDTCDYKVQINGSLCHITAIFGMTLAGLIMKSINSINTKHQEKQWE